MASRKSPAFAPPAKVLAKLYDDLLAAYGEQSWWPADTAFEVVVGAVLTQNAAWSNVEKAIDQLKRLNLLSLDSILASDHDTLADAIRPSGYFNIKAHRLRNLCEYLAEQGGLERFAERDLAAQREGLLSVNGVGCETADDILLYALEQPVFVIDTYTRRLLERMNLAKGDEPYDELRLGFERALPADVAMFKEYHALIVIHAKAACRKLPMCKACTIAGGCPTSSV